MTLKVPLTVDVGVGENWKEAQELQLAVAVSESYVVELPSPVCLNASHSLSRPVDGQASGPSAESGRRGPG